MKFTPITTAIALLFLFPFEETLAQSFMGMEGSYYAGISNVGRQPASILGGGVRMDINLIGADLSFTNNYIGISRRALFSERSTAWSDPDFKANYLTTRNTNFNKTANIGAEVMGPGFMMQLNSRNAFAFGVKARSISMAHNFSPEFAQLLYTEFESPELWTRLSNQNADLQQLTWNEYYITYAREIFNTGSHVIRAGVSAKLLQGQFGAFAYMQDLDYEFFNDSAFNIYNTTVNYATSNNPQITDPDAPYQFEFVGRPGIGFDFGAEYEFRPDWVLDRERKNRCDDETYLLKIGTSISDLGGITFTKGQYSGSYLADQQDLTVSTFDVGSFAEFDSLMGQLFTEQESPATFRMQLPTSLNFNADYNIGRGFFANFDVLTALRTSSNQNKVNHITRFQLTPRWDSRWFGVYMPLSVNTHGNLGLGLTLRAGPLVIGSNDLTAFMGRQYIYQADIHVALKVPILYKCCPGKSGKNRGIGGRSKGGKYNREGSCPAYF